MTAYFTASEDPLVSFIGLNEPSVLDAPPPVSPGQLAIHDSCCTLEEYEIIAPNGIPLRIFVQPSNSKSAILTYHDMGTNYSSFLGFFGCPEMRVICKHFTVYHVCAPGHYEGSPNIAPGDWIERAVKKVKNVVTRKLVKCVKQRTQPASYGHHEKSVEKVNVMQPEGQEEALLKNSEPDTGDHSASLSNVFTVLGRPSAYQNKVPVYPSMDELAEMLTSVVDYFKLDYFIGFGMGAGSNVLLRYALHHPDKVLATFLLNPNGTTHTYYEWFRNRWSDLPNLQRGIFNDSLLNQLEAHWFGFGLAENEDLIAYYTQLLHSLNPVNVAGYIDAYINRTDLGLVRSLELPSIIEQREKAGTQLGPPTAIKTNSCLVTGSLATDLSRALADLNGRMDPRKTQFLLISDCTGFLMEENPSKLAVNFLHFLRNEGLVINMTPEKLQKEAVALQMESAARASAVVPTSAMLNDPET